MPIYPTNQDTLFTLRGLTTLLRDQTTKISTRLDELHDDELLVTPTEDIVDTIYDELYLPPIVLNKQGVSHTPRSINMHLGPGGRPMRVDAYVYAVEFPFIGASGLFNHAPENRDLDPPRATLNSRSYEGSIIVEVVAKDDSEGNVRAEVDKQIAKIERYVAFQALQLDPFNSTLRDPIREKVEARKTIVFKARRIAASLGYPMARRDEMPATYAAPITRKKIVPLPTAISAFMPEWTPRCRRMNPARSSASCVFFAYKKRQVEIEREITRLFGRGN
jgi:hypothetical protein